MQIKHIFMRRFIYNSLHPDGLHCVVWTTENYWIFLSALSFPEKQQSNTGTSTRIKSNQICHSNTSNMAWVSHIYSRHAEERPNGCHAAEPAISNNHPISYSQRQVPWLHPKPLDYETRDSVVYSYGRLPDSRFVPRIVAQALILCVQIGC